MPKQFMPRSASMQYLPERFSMHRRRTFRRFTLLLVALATASALALSAGPGSALAGHAGAPARTVPANSILAPHIQAIMQRWFDALHMCTDWKTLTTESGDSFRNRALCVRFLVSGGELAVPNVADAR